MLSEIFISFGYVNPAHVEYSSRCVNIIHVASYSCVNLVHVASSSCINLTHVELSSYVNLNIVASSTIVLDPHGRKPIVDDTIELSNLYDPFSKKRNYNHTRKFQDSWVAKLPWTNMCLRSDGLLRNVKCKICS